MFVSEAIRDNDCKARSCCKYTRNLPTCCRLKTLGNKQEHLVSNFENTVSNYKGEFYQCGCFCDSGVESEFPVVSL